MSTVIDNRDSWPFPAITNATDPDQWVEISQEHADDLMNAVPPIFIHGGFMVSEPHSHTLEGVAILCTVVRFNGRLLAKHLPRTMAAEAHAMAARAVRNA